VQRSSRNFLPYPERLQGDVEKVEQLSYVTWTSTCWCRGARGIPFRGLNTYSSRNSVRRPEHQHFDVEELDELGSVAWTSTSWCRGARGTPFGGLNIHNWM
jgi:hypothetical protein